MTAADPTADKVARPTVIQRVQQREPDGQHAGAQPAHAAAARRSASVFRCDRTLRMPLSRVLRL
jgi:hypothetical protein